MPPNTVATRTDVARLLGRAAFGATKADLDRWGGQASYADVVASLFPPQPVTARPPTADEPVRLALSQHPNDVAGAQRWWLERMRTTAWPLEERMTLFWHDHFATAYGPQPDVGMVVTQNQTLRTHALGSFRALANAMSVDAAMLFWLNGVASRVGFANENYAREFLELFTLGTVPQEYSETDIRQAARAFTGWTVQAQTRLVQFTSARHDRTVKTVLGRTFGGYPANDPRETVEYQEVTEAALGWQGGVTAARFLAYKLVLAFGYQPDTANLDGDPLVSAVAAELRAGDRWDVGAAVRTMLLSDDFRYAPAASRHQLVRSPVELVVHAAKILGVVCDLPANQAGTSLPTASARRMGQIPFQPPNVGGWPSGTTWLSQTTNLARYDMFLNMVSAWRTQRMDQVTKLPASGAVADWTAFLGLGGLTADTTTRLQEYLAAAGTTNEADKQVSMLVLLGTSPDWQVM